MCVQNKRSALMAGIKRRVLRRQLFKQFSILPVASKFLLSLVLFTVNSMENFQINSDTHNTQL
jgi:hypothetical protein